MAVEHSCGNIAYRLSYQKKLSGDPAPKYYKTTRFYCKNCDIILKMVEE